MVTHFLYDSRFYARLSTPFKREYFLDDACCVLFFYVSLFPIFKQSKENFNNVWTFLRLHLLEQILKAQKPIGENLKVVWAKFSTLSLAVVVMIIITWHEHGRPCLELKM